MNLSQMKSSDIAFTFLVITTLKLIWELLVKLPVIIGFALAVACAQFLYEERAAIWDTFMMCLELVMTSIEVLLDIFWFKGRSSE